MKSFIPVSAAQHVAFYDLQLQVKPVLVSTFETNPEDYSRQTSHVDGLLRANGWYTQYHITVLIVSLSSLLHDGGLSGVFKWVPGS